MIEIGRGLLGGGKGISPGHRTMTEAGQLGKNEPHPVTLLLAPAQFGKDAPVDRRLRIDKALEIERAGQGGGPAPA